jgi:hypothetical protein
MVRGKGARPVEARSGPAGAFLSTRHFASKDERLTLAVLGARLATATHVFLASAFYDLDFCEGLLLGQARKGLVINVLLNGLGGTRLIDQRTQLAALEARLRERGCDAEVRLAFEPGIFHTKLLLVESRRGKAALIGSANATMAALTSNEELLVEVPVDERLAKYARRIWSTGVRLDALDGRLTARYLVAFFRSGSLYFKPAASLQVTLNPFADLFSSLTDAERSKLGAARLPYSEQESGVGAFNLRRAIGLSDDRESAESEVKKASIKPYAVETCFGYWVPRAVNDELQRKLEEVAIVKRRHLVRFRDTLARTGTAVLTQRYAAYVEAVRQLLIASGVAFSAELDGLPRNPFEPKLFAKFLERVTERLHGNDFVKRLSEPFVQGPMPEIWDDPPARHEFVSSFFEFLEYVSMRPERRSRVPGQILDRIDAQGGGPVDASSLEARLVKLLKEEGWADNDWRPGRKRVPGTTS